MKIENLNVRIGEKIILEDINLDFEDRGWTSIVGPNGSGKSTLLKAILGVLPYSGSIKAKHGNIYREVYKDRK